MQNIARVKTAFVILTAFASFECLGQSPARTFGENTADRAQSIRVTQDGGYVVAGTTDLTSSGSADVLVLKFDRWGQLQWQKTYGGPNEEDSPAILQTKDGGYVFATTTSSFTTTPTAPAVWVVRLNAVGDIVWQKSYGGPDGYGASAVYETADGLLIVAGSMLPAGTIGVSNGWILVLSKIGSTIWQRAYSTGGAEAFFGVSSTPDGGYVAVGQTGSAATPDAWIVKLKSTGELESQRALNG